LAPPEATDETPFVLDATATVLDATATVLDDEPAPPAPSSEPRRPPQAA
jgi:hypothetical protein